MELTWRGGWWGIKVDMGAHVHTQTRTLSVCPSLWTWMCQTRYVITKGYEVRWKATKHAVRHQARSARSTGGDTDAAKICQHGLNLNIWSTRLVIQINRFSLPIDTLTPQHALLFFLFAQGAFCQEFFVLGLIVVKLLVRFFSVFHKLHFMKWTPKPFSPLSFLCFFFFSFSPTHFLLHSHLLSCLPVLSLHLSVPGRWVIFLCFFSWRGERELRQGALAQLELKALIIVGASIFQSVRPAIHPVTKWACSPCCRGDGRGAGGQLMYYFCLCSLTRKRQKRLTGYWRDWDLGLNWWVKTFTLYFYFSSYVLTLLICQVIGKKICFKGMI